MIYTITVHDIDLGVKSWLNSQACCCGVSMDEFVRCLIHEYRTIAECRRKPSEAFKLYRLRTWNQSATSRTLRLQDDRTSRQEQDVTSPDFLAGSLEQEKLRYERLLYTKHF